MNKFIPISIVVGVLGLAIGVAGKSSLQSNVMTQNTPPISLTDRTRISGESLVMVEQKTSLDQSLVRFEKTLDTIERRLTALEKEPSKFVESVDKDLNEESGEDQSVATEEKEYIEHTEKFLSLETRLFEEEVDKEWADTMQESFEKDLEHEELAGARINFSSCGSSICKLELELADGMSTSEYLQRMSTQRSWNGPTFFSADANGHIQLFIERENAQL